MSTFTDVRELGTRLQNYNFEVFKEPRGIIRILQLVFSFLAIVVLRGYNGYINIEYGFCGTSTNHVLLPIDYPFDMTNVVQASCNTTYSKPVSLNQNFSGVAEFLFTTCWVSAVFVLIISFVYVKYREDYESNGNLALVDFIVSVILSVMWIGSFAAWAHAQSVLKDRTEPNYLKVMLHYCQKNADSIDCGLITRSSVSGLTVSMILSFSNFFLWAGGLWFLYKETPWYLQFQRS